MTDRRCWFWRLGGCDYRPDGRPDRMHFIKKARLIAAGLTREQVWDPRVWRDGCRRHHHLFDQGFVRVTLEQHPPSVRDYAAEHGFAWLGQREGWRKIA